jgi:hypothetical protein
MDSIFSVFSRNLMIHFSKYLLFLILFQSSLINGQICQNDIPDFFYNINFSGPLFDQSVYTVTTSNFSINSPVGTILFTFNIQPQTIYTRPSFVSKSVTDRALNNTPGIITITASDSNFSVLILSNDSYALITNTS